MGNALMSRVRPAPEPEPAPVEEVLDPVRKLTMAGRNPRLSFYSKAKEKTEKLDDGRYGEMSWFDFLVHTELCTMNYDALSKSDEDQLAHLVRMLENMKVPATLRKPVEDVIPFVCEVKAKMPNNPYHNSRHVTDVTQCMYTLLLATKVAHRLEPIELAAAFVGAICHDLDHPGLSNTWQNNEQTELARKYDGESPLEHHHLDEFVALAAKYDLLGNIEPAQAARFKEIVTEMILATDMARHAKLMEKITASLTDKAFDPMHDEVGINLLLAIALKCSDISNQVRPWTVANRWNAVVYEEFYAEGDLDRAKGRAVAPLQDRTSNDVNKSSVGFIRFIVKPLFQIYADIMKRCADLDDRSMVDSRAVEECLYILDDNMQRYENALNGMDNENTEAQFETLDALADQVGDGGAAAPKKTPPLAAAARTLGESVLASLDDPKHAQSRATLSNLDLPGINTDAGSNQGSKRERNSQLQWLLSRPFSTRFG
ncbi:3',5'-cyclic-nucleotide phosphodiesterase [Aureococcus anophagefferens]|nr:3',5'-cyclic-nucleotide phosphodiesterase [Aureococcus anophagefferens]